MIAYRGLSQCGRLGNQLWQIAATAGIAASMDTEPRFPAWDYQPFFRLPEQFFDNVTPDMVDATTLVPHLDHRAAPYLQDYSLFSHIETELKDWLAPSNKALDVLKRQWNIHFADLEEPLISLHIRRGDNVTHPQGYHPLRSMQYYRDALELGPEGTIVCFSDDPEWCRANLEEAIGQDIAVFYEGTPRPREYIDRLLYENAPVLDWIDLQLMAACDWHVISNSTYAWWGAFLSQDPEPIYPSNWFGTLVRGYTDASLMFPPGWVQVPDLTEGI
jgi:hypothetical protein